VLLKERYRVYFPFVDGLLAYNCPKCGFRCCKGAGFAATPSEFVTLRRHYPALAYFTSVAQKTTEPLVQLINFGPQCFFLADDGRCDVHARHGRAAKPFVCKSFPINAFRLDGDVLVADVNFLCPIELASGAPGDERIHHEDLLRDIVEHADIVVAAATRPRSAGLSHARIDLEERLRERCAGLPLAELCAVYQACARGGDAEADDAAVASARAERPSLAETRTAWTMTGRASATMRSIQGQSRWHHSGGGAFTPNRAAPSTTMIDAATQTVPDTASAASVTTITPLIVRSKRPASSVFAPVPNAANGRMKRTAPRKSGTRRSIRYSTVALQG
jgi:hypothetical protein